MTRLLLASVLVAIATAAACGGRVEEAEANASPAAPAPSNGSRRSATLERVVTSGASMTAGFGVGTSFAHALQAALPGVPEIQTAADLFFFGDPGTSGDKLVTGLLAKEPTLVVALDFPFWYGYGDCFSGDELAERLERLELGLRQLERFTCPVVVGDFPDMSTAIGQMLRAAQVPSASAREALNRRIGEWAGARQNVHLLAWSAHRETLREIPEGGLRSKRFELPESGDLLLADRLHPSLEGQAAIALWTVELLVERGIVRPDEALFSFDDVVERLEETKERLFAQPGK